jgi:hypothetical protein
MNSQPHIPAVPATMPLARNARKQAPPDEPRSVRMNVLFLPNGRWCMPQSNRPVQGADHGTAPAVPCHEAIERGERSVHAP